MIGWEVGLAACLNVQAGGGGSREEDESADADRSLVGRLIKDVRRLPCSTQGGVLEPLARMSYRVDQPKGGKTAA
jgi:hypothetical protein